MTTINNRFFLQPEWPAPTNIKAYSSLKESNIGFAEQPIRTPGNINKALLKSSLQLPNDPIWLDQKHTAIARAANPNNHGREGDAVYTNETNQVCAVLTADCLPLLVCNKQGTKVAAIHAGWRGLVNGVIEETLDALNIHPNETLVWLGPAIGPSRFEIRQDVYEIFLNKQPEAIEAMHQISDEQWLADIYSLAKLRLEKRHVNQVYGGEYCTHSDPERFFSYRRDGKIVGSIVSLIWISG